MTDISSVHRVVRHLEVTVRGRVDALAAPELRHQLEAAIPEGCRELLIDLEAVTFLDSAGLAALVKARKDALAAGVPLRLIAPRSEDAMRVFRLTGFDEIFDFVPVGRSDPRPSA